MIAADPRQGGATWAVLQYVLGLQELGNEVYLIEPIQQSALQPAGAGLADSENADYFLRVAAEFGLRERAALLLEGTKQTSGLEYGQLQKIDQSADVLINISRMLTVESPIGPVHIR